jgi:hypothetical protein
MPNCKHGLDQQFCALCTNNLRIEPLDDDAIRINNTGKYFILLRKSNNESQNKGFYLDSQIIGSVSNFEISNSTVVNKNNEKNHAILKRFKEVALEKGFLFIPSHPLTRREHESEGPPRCFKCHTILDFESEALGCSICRYYACRCGRCVCGYEGRNYLGQHFKQLPPLPISREDRLEYIRIVRLLEKLDGSHLPRPCVIFMV